MNNTQLTNATEAVEIVKRGRGRPKSMQKRADILEAAKILILESGFDGTSMDDISIKANVSKKTLYSHFKNKEDLFNAVLNEYWSKTLSELDIEINTQEQPKSALKTFSEKLVKFFLNKNITSLFRVIIHEHYRLPELTKDISDKQQAPFVSTLSRYFNHQIKAGVLSIKDATLAASHFIGMIKEYDFWPTMLGSKGQLSEKEQDENIDLAIDMFLRYYAV